MHAKFLRGKNRGGKRLFCSPSSTTLIMADRKGRSKREGLGNRTYITVKNVT